MRTGIDPTVDFAFKRVFAAEENAPLLVHFLNAVIDPASDRRIVDARPLTTLNERLSEDDKLTIVDLRCRDARGRRFIIEMQVVVTQAFRERLLYYWATDYVQQLQEGADCSELMPTILICVVKGRLFGRAGPHHLKFRLRADGCSEDFTDRLEIHTVELAKFEATADAVANALDQWLFFLKNGESLDIDQLPEKLDAPEVKRAVEVLDMISQSDRDRAKYEAELKRRRDLVNRDELVRGYGREEGREEGREQGQLIERIRILTQILGDPVPPVDELKQLSLEKLSQMAAECQRRARERGMSV